MAQDTIYIVSADDEGEYLVRGIEEVKEEITALIRRGFQKDQIEVSKVESLLEVTFSIVIKECDIELYPPD